MKRTIMQKLTEISVVSFKPGNGTKAGIKEGGAYDEKEDWIKGSKGWLYHRFRREVKMKLCRIVEPDTFRLGFGLAGMILRKVASIKVSEIRGLLDNRNGKSSKNEVKMFDRRIRKNGLGSCSWKALALLVIPLVFLICGCGKKIVDPPPSNNPTLSVNPKSLSFSATNKDTKLPSEKNLDIRKIGDGVLKWEIRENCDWLDASPDSGEGDRIIRVQPDTILELGSYTTTIEVVPKTNGASSEFIDVEYTVTNDKPILIVSPDFLAFEDIENSDVVWIQEFSVRKEGNGHAYWRITEDSSWLGISPRSGTDDQTIAVSVNTGDLEAGIYQAAIIVYCEECFEQYDTVQVELTVKKDPPPPPPPAEPCVNPLSLNFDVIQGDNYPTSQIFTIENCGGGTLEWSVEDDQEWLLVSPVKGENQGGTSTTVTVWINNTLLWIKEHTAIIVVSYTHSNEKDTVIVNYEVRGPIIALNPSELDTFIAYQNAEEPLNQVFSVSNIGWGTLNWEAEASVYWLQLYNASGKDNGQVTVSINTTDLSPGNHKGLITVRSLPSDSNASNSPQTIPVVYRVVGPIIEVNPPALTFSACQGQAVPEDQVVTITNVGGDSFTGSLSSDADWLEVRPLEIGGILRGDSRDVTVSINRTDLSLDTYTATITLQGNAENTPQYISVTYRVTPPPHIQVTPSTLSFEWDLSEPFPSEPKELTITNTGGSGCLFEWTAESNVDWLSLNPATWRGNGILRVSLDQNKTPRHDDSARITIRSDNADNEVVVEVTLDVY